MEKLIYYPQQCKDTKGGVKKIFLFAYEKYLRSQIQSAGMILSEFPSNYIFEFRCEGGYSQTSSVQGGTVSYEHSIQVDLPKVYNVLDIQNFLLQDMRCIVLTNNDEYLMAGARNGLTGSVSSASGTDKNAFNGFKVELKGQEEEPMFLIEDLNTLGLFVLNETTILTNQSILNFYI
jgi:hypothetical protein